MLQMFVWIACIILLPAGLAFVCAPLIESTTTRDKERRRQNIAAFQTEMQQVYQRVFDRRILLSFTYLLTGIIVFAGACPLIEVIGRIGPTPTPGYGWRGAALVLVGVLMASGTQRLDRWMQRRLAWWR